SPNINSRHIEIRDYILITSLLSSLLFFIILVCCYQIGTKIAGANIAFLSSIIYLPFLAYVLLGSSFIYVISAGFQTQIAAYLILMTAVLVTLVYQETLNLRYVLSLLLIASLSSVWYFLLPI